eukprot:SAG31_NODE_11457_length_1028_cov_0.886975_1_plen_187_part_00
MLPTAALALALAAALAHAHTAVAHCPAVADVVGGARRLCSGSPAAESLRSVGVLPKEGNGTLPVAARVLEEHGFLAAIDLRLLQPGQEEAAELMAELRIRGVSIADRSKVRLLIGERDADGAAECGSEGDRFDSKVRTRHRTGGVMPGAGGRVRQLQGEASSAGDDGLSTDTVLRLPVISARCLGL